MLRCLTRRKPRSTGILFANRKKYAPEQKERLILRLAGELQAEVDKFKYGTAADMAFVDAVRKEVGRELVWLDVHKGPATFVRETHLSP